MQPASSYPRPFTTMPRPLAAVMVDDPFDSVAMLLVMVCSLLALVCSFLSFWP